MTAAPAEFDRQLDHFVALGYPALAGSTEADFRDKLAPLRDAVAARPDAEVVRHEDHIPFILVPSGIPGEEAMARTALGKQQGITVLDAEELTTFRPIEGVDVP
ncbi:MAG: DUF5701 family protein, partial [Nocardiaceae bacterium]|nr:DUF5701 family protein [Nocardiaceae bacterium]